jgi:hypothetical protein
MDNVIVVGLGKAETMRHDELLALAREHGHVIVIDDETPPSREDLLKALDGQLLRERRYRNPAEELRKMMEELQSTSISDLTTYYNVSSNYVDDSDNWLEIPWSRNNGDLSYLYRKPRLRQHGRSRQRCLEIRQPCWSHRRWRSITSKHKQVR